MVRRRFEHLPRERQAEILFIAAQAFARNGFRATSYNQLLSRARIGKGSAYYYFTDKQDLFLTAVKSCHRAFFESISEVTRPESAAGYWLFIEAITRRGFEFMQKDPTSAALLRCFAREAPTLDELSSHELRVSLEGYYVDLVSLGQELQAIRGDLPFELLTELARALSGTFDQWFITHASRAGKARRERLAKQFAVLSRALLGARPQARKPAIQRTRRPATRPAMGAA